MANASNLSLHIPHDFPGSIHQNPIVMIISKLDKRIRRGGHLSLAITQMGNKKIEKKGE